MGKERETALQARERRKKQDQVRVQKGGGGRKKVRKSEGGFRPWSAYSCSLVVVLSSVPLFRCDCVLSFIPSKTGTRQESQKY